MKITQKTLRKIIKEELTKVLQESSAVGPEDLPEGVKILIEQWSEDEILISYVDEYGENTYGHIQIDTEVQLNSQFPCLNAMMVAHVKAEKNYGPLLYDIAIEVATMKAGGLVSDRTIVSSDAYKVWEYYVNNRNNPDDVEIKQLDNENDSFNDGPDNDCLQTISHEYASKNDTTWMDEPLSKLYRKKPTTLETLEELDLLILEDFELS